ncbi:septal ring lytic transglycosylase RlpA family protein [Ferrimonas aestuarii]|nr:septal ring lytic transglycosylase RlpA family protein [Ferrimonas aestuarii]
MKLIELSWVWALLLLGCSHQAPIGYSQQGQALAYDNLWQSWETANGEIFNQGSLTAAHKTLPFGTLVKVTNLDSGTSVIVRINDRGPFDGGQVIMMSLKAYGEIASAKNGETPVRIEVVR